LVWACTENERKQNSRKNIIYESGNNKIWGVDHEINGKVKWGRMEQ
jgi:hypothetical protein